MDELRCLSVDLCTCILDSFECQLLQALLLSGILLRSRATLICIIREELLSFGMLRIVWLLDLQVSSFFLISTIFFLLFKHNFPDLESTAPKLLFNNPKQVQSTSPKFLILILDSLFLNLFHPIICTLTELN